MAYGTVKTDTIIFDQGGADQNVTVSGIYRAITSGVTVSGTISGAVLIGTTTVSGATVTGTTANFVSGVFTTVVSGATVTGNQSSFTSGNFVTLSGATATFTSGVIASGTATNPSLSIVGDGNTGIYSPGADQLAVATDGTGRLFVDATGNVGVGTASPTSFGAGAVMQSIVGTTSYGGYLGFTNNVTVQLWADESGLAGNMGTRTNHPLIVTTNNIEKLRITSAGLVGIGTSAPDSTLHVLAGAVAGLRIGFNGTSVNYYDADTQIFRNIAGTERARIDSSGRVGIGTSAPWTSGILDCFGNAKFGASSTNGLYLGITSGTPYIQGYDTTTPSSSVLAFYGGSSEAMRIDSSGRLLVGTSTASKNADRQAGTKLALVGVGDVLTSQVITGYTANSAYAAPLIDFQKSRGSSDGSMTIVAAGDYLGGVQFLGSDGTNFIRSVLILAEVDGTPGTNDMPGRLTFCTTADGAASPTERMRIDSSGNVGIGTTSPLTKLEVRSGVITAGSIDAPNGAEILRGYYGSNGALVVIGSEYSSGGTVIGYAVKPSTSASDAFLSSASGALSRGAYTIAGNIHKWYIGGSQTVAENSSVTMSEAMRIDSSGRLLVGTSSARTNVYYTTVATTPKVQFETSGSSYSNGLSLIQYSASGFSPVLTLGLSASNTQGTNAAITFNHELGAINFAGNDGINFRTGASIVATNDQAEATPSAGAWTVGNCPTRLVFSTTSFDSDSPTEKMRITRDGFLKAGPTGALFDDTGRWHELNSEGSCPYILWANHTGAAPVNGIVITYSNATPPNNTSSEFLFCSDTNGSVLRASIRSNGGLANFQANNVNLSDINTKKDITSVANTWDCVKEWEIVNYRYKDQPDDSELNIGVIAQQVAKSCPEVITVFQEAKEATNGQLAQEERLGIKEQQMYWMAIKALQETQVRIEQLEAKVADLESA